MSSWVFLLVGGLGAIGAAMALGTVAALVQLRRHGTLPGGAPDAPTPDASDVRRLWVRITIGGAVAFVCFGSLAAQGLLFAPAA